jgi:hypothetical protein
MEAGEAPEAGVSRGRAANLNTQVRLVLTVSRPVGGILLCKSVQ